MPLSLAEKINGRTLDFGLNWAVIKLAKKRKLSDRAPQRSSGVQVPTGAHESARWPQIWRELWPETGTGWKHDWYSFPLASDARES
jgi:hypothetical protein